MSADAALKFIDTVMQHYPPFKWDEEQEKAWAATMVRELGGFPDEVIRTAAEIMVRTRKDRRTPLIPECLDVCAEARRRIDGDRQSQSLISDQGYSSQNRDWTADRLKLASELMDTPIGKQAAKDGSVGALWSFARKNARLPQPGAETNGYKEAARGFDEAYASLIRRSNEKPAMRALQEKLEALGAEMLRRRHAIERRVLGGRA